MSKTQLEKLGYHGDTSPVDKHLLGIDAQSGYSGRVETDSLTAGSARAERSNWAEREVHEDTRAEKRPAVDHAIRDSAETRWR